MSALLESRHAILCCNEMKKLRYVERLITAGDKLILHNNVTRKISWGFLNNIRRRSAFQKSNVLCKVELRRNYFLCIDVTKSNYKFGKIWFPKVIFESTRFGMRFIAQKKWRSSFFKTTHFWGDKSIFHNSVTRKRSWGLICRGKKLWLTPHGLGARASITTTTTTTRSWGKSYELSWVTSKWRLSNIESCILKK